MVTKSTSARGSKITVRRWVKRILLWMLALILSLGIFGVIGGIYLYSTVKLPDPNKDFQTNTTHLYYRDGKTELGRLAVQNRESIPYSEMPQNIKDAVIAIENQTFWTDPGVSLMGMFRGAWSILTGGNKQGGSTITQQYIKIMYLTSEQKMSRKVKEVVLAYKMGKELSKEQILEGYLNTIYFGRGAYGIQAAAKAFFGLPAKQMNLSQAVALAAVLNDPGGFDPPHGNMKLLLERYQVTLNNMLEMGKITKAQRDAIYYKLPDFPDQKTSSRYGGPKGFLVKSVEKELVQLGFDQSQISGGGLQIISTFDQKLQDAAVKSVQTNLAAAGKQARSKADPSALRSGLASVQVGTGDVLAMYGGSNFVKDSRNWATTPRPTGSVFKINALIAALRDGMSLETQLNGNTVTPPGDKKPVRNAGGVNYGPVSLLKATFNSINTAYYDVVAKMKNGPQKVVKAANDLGLSTNTSWPMSDRIALGQAEVSPLAEAGALATLANDGIYIAPHFVKEVRDVKGRVLYKASAKGEQRIKKDIAEDATYALSRVVEEGTATKLQKLGYPAAGKTGTRDVNGQVQAAWFAGTTKQVATAVDFIAGEGGNLDLNPYRKSGRSFYGSSYPADTWLAYMYVAQKGQPTIEFTKPISVNNSNDEPEATPTPSNTPTPSATPEPTQPNDKSKPDPPQDLNITPEPKPETSTTPTPTPKPEPKPKPKPTVKPNPAPVPSSSPEPVQPSKPDSGGRKTKEDTSLPKQGD